MTATNNLPNPLLVAVTDDLPRPVAVSTESSSASESHTGLPRPAGSKLNVSDAGRIKFGAGYRLPLSK
jgi:hypothetical protein